MGPGIFEEPPRSLMPILNVIAALLLVAMAAVAYAESKGLAVATSQEFSAHPDLAVLAEGEALDLGRYECESRAPNLRCPKIFDYSRINYDPFNHRFLVFGGGHAATGRTDIDAFDMQTLRWGNLYPSMGCKAIAKGDTDPRGFHRQSGHPVARHTYDQNVVAEYGGHGWLLMFSTEGFSGHCHPENTLIRAPAAFPLTTKDPVWSFASRMESPWGYAGSAEFDPVSGMVILLGGQSHGLWVYDPTAQKVVAAIANVKRAKNSSNLIFNPRDNDMYLIDSKTLQVRRLRLYRDDWEKTIVQTVETKGEPPGSMRNFAYDSRNHVIGGIKNGVFHALDLNTFTWHSYPVTECSESGASIGTVRHHAIDYDPVNNVFILVTGRTGSLRTWAFRFRN